jgi:hypothetical protein
MRSAYGDDGSMVRPLRRRDAIERSGRNRMRFIRCLIGGSALLATALLAGSALASDNKIALIPGGPHPYFKPWEQAAADAKKDFGIASVDFKVPTDWKLNLQTELIESLVAQGYKAFGIFPGDAVGINSEFPQSRSRAARRIRQTRASALAPTSITRPISAQRS